MKRLIEQFNDARTHLVISDYPEKTKRGEKNYGIAWYTKELTEAMANKYKARFVILAEKTLQKEPKVHAGGKVLVIRVFDKKHPSLFPRILRWLFVFSRIKHVYVHSEFCADGGFGNFILLPFFLALIRFTGKQITYYSHNVVTDLNDIAPHLNLKSNSLLVDILNKSLGIYYRLLDLIVDRFVVMDEIIKKRLMNFVNPNKITLTPFWIRKPKKIISQFQAKKRLCYKKRDFILLYFGFLTYYKGADWIVKTIKQIHKQSKYRNIKLIVAGGRAYSLKDKKYYQNYYQNLLNAVKLDKRIKMTGFVPEHKIPLYFAASDLVVFPYRGLIGSSATLIQAATYSKPFVLSSKMESVLQNHDMALALKMNNLKTKDLLFDHDIRSFKRILNKAKNNKFRKQLISLSNDLAISRNFNLLLTDCYNNLYSGLEYKTGLVVNSKTVPNYHV